MSSTYQGDPSLVTAGVEKTINGATNASPIVVSTTASHGYQTGDEVVVRGVAGNTAANGTFAITVTDSTHFRLDGSTGSGAYTSGGTVQNQFLSPAGTIPSDGDTMNAASVNVMLELLADRTQFLGQRKLKIDTFTADGTWTCPANVTAALLIGYGGSGGGAGGRSGGTVTSLYGLGGGGGAGAVQSSRMVATTPGGDHAVDIGAAGAAGVGGTTPTAGSAGADTIFTAPDSTELARFRASGGGYPVTTAVDNQYLSASGGQPVASTGNGLYGGEQYLDLSATAYLLTSQQGGLSSGNSNSTPGGDSPQGYAGQAPHSSGVNSGSYFAGASGGSGGAGPNGAGPKGGAGGGGNNAGAGSAGTAGDAPAANSGAGGGGGGGGGAGSASGGAGANGAAGSAGKLLVIYYA